MAAITVPDDANVYAALNDGARHPDRLFMETADGRVVRYGDVPDITARYATLLASEGVGKADFVAGILEKSPEAVLLYLAVCRLGAVYVPVHIGLTDGEVAHILGDTRPKLVVCDPSRDGVARAAACTVLTLDAVGTGTLVERSAAMLGQSPLQTIAPSDPNAMVYTSGTTGRPKGALLSAGAVIWNARSLASCWGITDADTLLHANPMAYGLFGTTTPAMAGGASMILLPKFDTETVLAQLQRATIFAGVPTYYSRLMPSPGSTGTCAVRCGCS